MYINKIYISAAKYCHWQNETAYSSEIEQYQSVAKDKFYKPFEIMFHWWSYKYNYINLKMRRLSMTIFIQLWFLNTIRI